MPLFEVDAQRPLLVQPGQSPAAPQPGVGTTAHRVVDSHIDGLLGEQIFPVAPGVGPDEPHLLALDATGSPVVVELVADLDRAALTRALDHAGSAGRLTRGALSERYHGGPSAFHRDVAAFYDSVPITRSQPGRSSARLIIICQEASEEILNAVDFLRQPTMPVEVLKMGVVHSADGRRFVDVSPLVIHPASAPTAPSLSAPPAAVGAANSDQVAPPRAAEQAAGLEPEIFAEGVAVGLALTGKMPAETQTRSRRRAARPRTPESAPSADAGLAAGGFPEPVRGAGAVPPPPVPAPEPTSPPPAPPAASSRYSGLDPDLEDTRETRPRPLSEHRPGAAAPTVRRRSRADRFAGQSFEDAESYAPAGHRLGLGEAFAEVAAPAFDLPVPEPRWSGVEDDLPRLQVPPLEPPRLSTPPSDPLDDGRWSSVPPPSNLQGGYDPLTSPVPPEPAEPWAPTTTVDYEVDPDLIALAATLGHPTVIVWSRPRRRQHFEAVLHPDGTIELTDGGRYRHPDHAASAASGSPTADGWSVWRLGHDGPTLMDAFRHRFA